MNLKNQALVIHSFNPFNLSQRESKIVPSGAQLVRCMPKSDAPMVCIINGEAVARECWDCTLEAGDIVVFQTLPAGGGGGSNPLSVILGLVLVVVGAWTSNPALIAAGVGILSAGFIPTPKAPLGIQSVDVPSPTYNVALGGNSARLNQPIPVIYGRHLIMPDFAAQPYATFANNDSFYHALLCLGNSGDIVIESIAIDDTSIDSFEEVQTQLQGSNFYYNQTIVDPAVVNSPEVANQTLEAFRPVGPFAAVGPGIKMNKLGIDFIFPRGLFFSNSVGELENLTVSWRVDIREITDQGEPVGSWLTIANETYTDNRTMQLRISRDYVISASRYEVRCTRTSARVEGSQAQNDFEWQGMRAYVETENALEQSAAYLAVKIRATSQLSGASQRKISVTMRRMLPKWHPLSGWSALVETRSIAWALADILRNTTYGAGIPDNRIDLQTLYELDQLWESRGDTFNGVFDKRVTIWQALTTVARAGRARPLLRGSVFTFVRDTEQSLPVALFNMRNIQKDSFAIDYAMYTEDSPDGVELEYFDERTWNSNTVLIPFPGVVEPSIVLKGSLMGVTNRNQAIREAAYTMADIAYRRSTIRFVTEMEGFLPSLGELIAVSHDVPNWGVSAEIESIDENEPYVATVTETPEWSKTQQNYAILSDSHGDVFGPYKIRMGSSEREIIFEDTPDHRLFFYTGTERERTKISIGVTSNFLKYAKIKAIEPKDDGTISITAAIEDARVHNADANFLPNFINPRPAYYMPLNTPVYDSATLELKSGKACWVARSDDTIGSRGDSYFYYQ